MLPAREAFDQVEAVAQDEGFLGVEDRDAEIGVGRLAVALVDRPVEAGHAVAALDALVVLEHDVVAGFAVIVGVAAAAVQHVVADDRGVEEQFGILAGEGIETLAAFDPVVALVAEQEVAAGTAEDEVVAGAAKDFLAVRAGDDEIPALVAEQQRRDPIRRG